MLDCMGAGGESKEQGSEPNLVAMKWIVKETGLSRHTIKGHLDRAGIVPYRFGKAKNATMRYRRSEIEAWMRSCGISRRR